MSSLVPFSTAPSEDAALLTELRLSFAQTSQAAREYRQAGEGTPSDVVSTSLDVLSGMLQQALQQAEIGRSTGTYLSRDQLPLNTDVWDRGTCNMAFDLGFCQAVIATRNQPDVQSALLDAYSTVRNAPYEPGQHMSAVKLLEGKSITLKRTLSRDLKHLKQLTSDMMDLSDAMDVTRTEEDEEDYERFHACYLRISAERDGVNEAAGRWETVLRSCEEALRILGGDE